MKVHVPITSCSLYKLLCSKGLKVDLGFFDDLFVPEHNFPAEYWFHSQDGLWVWKYEGNDIYLDLKETIRCACFRTNHTHPASSQPWDNVKQSMEDNTACLELYAWQEMPVKLYQPPRVPYNAIGINIRFSAG